MGDFSVDDETVEIDQVIQHLHRNEIFSDVRVIPVPGEREFRAHKLVLSLFSPVLSDRFYGKNNDKSDILYVHDVDISGVSNMMSYCYYGDPVLTNTFQVKETQKIANKYKIVGLSDECKRKISELDVDVSNVLMVLEMAVQYGNENKEKECLEIIGRNQEVVFVSETFIKMKFVNVCGILDDLRRMGYLTEVRYLRSALRWMDCEIDAHKNKLMEKVKISELSLDEFTDLIIDFPNFLTNIEISDAMREIKSMQKTEQVLRITTEESENVPESERNSYSGHLEDSENTTKSGCCRIGQISEGISVDIQPNGQRNEISEKNTRVIISITEVLPDDTTGAIVTVEDESSSRSLVFQITGDMEEGLLPTLSAGDHTFDNVDISYEGLYFMLACLKNSKAEMSSVNSIEAFKAAVFFQLQKLQDFLLMKIGNIIDYDPVYLDRLRCLTFFEDRLLQLITTKPRCVILHPNFIHCSFQLIEIILEQDELRIYSELQLLLVSIQWLEARKRLRWDSRSSLLNKIAFENIPHSDLLCVTKRHSNFFTDEEAKSVLAYNKNETHNTENKASLPEWYNFKSRRILSEDCE